MNKINISEALADCIMRFEGWQAPYIHTPGSLSWRNRNPGNLRPTNPNIQPHDENNYRVFDTLSAGWIELRFDINCKLTGHSYTNLTEKSTLHDFFVIYAPPTDKNDPTHYTQIVANWLNLIYNTAEVKPETTLKELMKYGK